MVCDRFGIEHSQTARGVHDDALKTSDAMANGSASSATSIASEMPSDTSVIIWPSPKGSGQAARQV